MIISIKLVAQDQALPCNSNYKSTLCFEVFVAVSTRDDK